jgi:flagellar protein FlaJ
MYSLIQKMNSYVKFCYRVLGKHMDERGIGARLTEKLSQADMDMSPGMFLSSWIMAVSIAIVAVVLFFSLLNLALNLDMSFLPAFENLTEVILSPLFILTTIILATVVAVPFSLTSKIQNKRIAIDRELPFALSHMSFVASTGAPPIAIFSEIASGRHGKVSQEFKKLVGTIEIEGEDIIAGMTRLAENTPSLLLRSLLTDLTKLAHTGGNLEAYFYDRLTRIMELKRQVQREFTQSLSFYAEIYVCLVLMSTLIGILFAVLGGMLMGGRIGPFSAEMFFNIIVYFVVPMANVMFGLVLMLAFSRGG